MTTKRTDQLQLQPGDRVVRTEFVERPTTATVKLRVPRESRRDYPGQSTVVFEHVSYSQACRDEELWTLADPDPDGDLDRAAEFLPRRNDDERPAIRTGGALVFAYWQDGVLRVTVDTGDVSEEQRGSLDVECAVRVDVEFGTVFERCRS